MSLKPRSEEKIRSAQLNLDDLRKKIASGSSKAHQFVEPESKGVVNKPQKKLKCDIRAIALSKSFQGNQVLKDVSVKCAGGTITAILGPSGSGKSTLLKFMATVIKADQGSLFFHNTDVFSERAVFRSQLAYVPQDDIIHRDLSVQDALIFSARLRCGHLHDFSVMEMKVGQLLKKLGLYERKEFRSMGFGWQNGSATLGAKRAIGGF